MPAVLTDSEARSLATRVVKDTKSARVKFGRTNGEPVLHVIVPAESARNEYGDADPTVASFTVKNASEWEECPLNQRHARNRDFAAHQPTEALMASNGKKKSR
jgi:hypothetical protein